SSLPQDRSVLPVWCSHAPDTGRTDRSCGRDEADILGAALGGLPGVSPAARRVARRHGTAGDPCARTVAVVLGSFVGTCSRRRGRRGRTTALVVRCRPFL